MKKLLCVLFALILPALTACGNTVAAPAADNAATAAETSAPAEATEAEALPESCRRWYGAAAQSGAAGTNSDIPLDDRAAYYVSSDFSLRMPDGSYTGLIYNHMTEGVTLEEFSGGRAVIGDARGRLAWTGVRYNAFTIEADNCAIPNLAPHERGLLRLDISGDCVMNGGGEEFGCLEEFDCVLITGSGTLRIENASGLSCGGGDVPLPALIVDGEVQLICSDIVLTPNLGDAPAFAQLGGTVCAERLECEGGDMFQAGGTLMCRGIRGLSRAVFRGGTALIDDFDCAGASLILSGGEAYITNALPEGAVIESGAGSICIPNAADAAVNGSGARIFDAERDGSRYYQTVYDDSWGGDDGLSWNSLCVSAVDGRLFAGVMTLSDCRAQELMPWGALCLDVRGDNAVADGIGGTSLIFDGGGTLRADSLSVWGWGGAHRPVIAVRGGTAVTVTGSGETAMGSQAGEEGLFVVDSGSFECGGNLWLQNAVLSVRGGEVHIMGSCNLEKGRIEVSGGRLTVEGTIWLGSGDVAVTGGVLAVSGGADGICADNGSVTANGGSITPA